DKCERNYVEYCEKEDVPDSINERDRTRAKPRVTPAQSHDSGRKKRAATSSPLIPATSVAVLKKPGQLLSCAAQGCQRCYVQLRTVAQVYASWTTAGLSHEIPEMRPLSTRL